MRQIRLFRGREGRLLYRHRTQDVFDPIKEIHMEVVWLFKPAHPLWHSVRSRLGTPFPIAAFARNPWRTLLAIQASSHSNNT